MEPATQANQPDQESLPLAAHLPYVAPFAVFMALLIISGYVAIFGVWEYPLRAAILAAVLWVFSRHVISFRLTSGAGSVAIGIGVFLVWIAPDVLFPAYRESVLFQNSIMGRLSHSIPTHLQSDALALGFRTLRAVVLVPIIEELFWRAWLMRWLIRPNFQAVPLGAYTAQSMLLTAVLFASEHGSFWDVGLAAGLIYNWWMIRTRSLGDCILAHAVTNGCLSAYVIIAGKWQYWP